jgi:hypothetical protein
MAQNQPGLSAGGNAVSKNVTIDPEVSYDPVILYGKWLFQIEAMSYEEQVLRERIKIMEEMGCPESGILGECRAQLMSIVLSK